MRTSVSNGVNTYQTGPRTASCFSLFPSVVRMLVSFPSRVWYCIARCSFCSMVRSSSSWSLCTGSKSSSWSSPSLCCRPLRAPFRPLIGGELLPLSNESRASATAGGLMAGEEDSRGDLESLDEFLGLVGPLLDIIADVEVLEG